MINSCGWVDGGGYKALLHAARAFEGTPNSITVPECIFSTTVCMHAVTILRSITMGVSLRVGGWYLIISVCVCVCS